MHYLFTTVPNKTFAIAEADVINKMLLFFLSILELFCLMTINVDSSLVNIRIPFHNNCHTEELFNCMFPLLGLGVLSNEQQFINSQSQLDQPDRNISCRLVVFDLFNRSAHSKYYGDFDMKLFMSEWKQFNRKYVICTNLRSTLQELKLLHF